MVPRLPRHDDPPESRYNEYTCTSHAGTHWGDHMGRGPTSIAAWRDTNKQATNETRTRERERRRGGGTSSLLVDHLLREPTPSLASAEKDLSTTLPEYMAEHIVLVPFSTAMVLDQLVPTLFVTLSLMRVVVSHGP